MAQFAAGQGTPPRANASAYEVEAKQADLSIGAEYLVHSIPAYSGYVIAEDYLVVEAALFAPRFTAVKLALADFQLRVNGATTTIEAQPASTVSYSIKSSDRGFTGLPQRAPGDPNSRPPLPAPPRVPTSDNGIDRQPPPPLEQQVAQAALPMGDRKVPISGVLFFPFKGKTATIKSLELIYSAPAGPLTLKFF